MATGEGDRATAVAARKRVETLRDDFEWAAVELAAAEAAMSTAYDGMARAHRGVVAQEYLAAHDDSRVLLNALRGVMDEAGPMTEQVSKS